MWILINILVIYSILKDKTKMMLYIHNLLLFNISLSAFDFNNRRMKDDAPLERVIPTVGLCLTMFLIQSVNNLMLTKAYSIPQSIYTSFMIAFACIRINAGNISIYDAFNNNLYYFFATLFLFIIMQFWVNYVINFFKVETMR